MGTPPDMIHKNSVLFLFVGCVSQSDGFCWGSHSVSPSPLLWIKSNSTGNVTWVIFKGMCKIESKSVIRTWTNFYLLVNLFDREGQRSVLQAIPQTQTVIKVCCWHKRKPFFLVSTHLWPVSRSSVVSFDHTLSFLAQEDGFVLSGFRRHG